MMQLAESMFTCVGVPTGSIGYGVHADRLGDLAWGARVWVGFIMASSQLSAPKFLNREMKVCETENHLLCGWCAKLLYKKITFPL